ncbi:hypothetical protein [Aquabacterium sp. OR-4]|uniref:hypothetical protein n=1 Tax=Aquabacterium sp. OR-4 TaxID=2978127 RepID=UPI0021B3D14D|nr:hypothetical protein [Aquabacterium sp. OR-4]MDT7838424.1 hypothetical protein [Aquabacterium sp. OR-4]
MPLKRQALLLGLACCLTGPAAAQAQAQAQLACSADFSAMGQGVQAVAIVLKGENGYEAQVNGVTTRAHGVVADEVIRPGLNLAADPYGPEYAGFNGAERSLVHLHKLLGLAHGPGPLQLPFALGAVRRIKTFELAARSDKFGGHVLLEAYNERQQLLGRVVRRVFVATCR